MKKEKDQKRPDLEKGRRHASVPEMVDQEWLESTDETSFEDRPEARMAISEEMEDFDPDALIPDPTMDLGDQFFID